MVFEIGRREKDLLLEILQLYPLVPPAHHRLSKTAPAGQLDEHQRLLEESLAAQRKENRKSVRALLETPLLSWVTPAMSGASRRWNWRKWTLMRPCARLLHGLLRKSDKDMRRTRPLVQAAIAGMSTRIKSKM